MYIYDIAIIDSGVDLELFPNAIGISIEESNESFVVGNSINDTVGHGSVVYSIINNHVDGNRIIVIKMPDWKESVDSSSLVYALEYIKNNVSCKVVNVSLGLKIDYHYNELYNVCKELSDMGIVVVSAFDNEGCYSYPAAFDCVIGVDSNNEIKNTCEL